MIATDVLVQRRLVRRSRQRLLGSNVFVYLRTMAVFVAIWELIAIKVANPIVIPSPGSVVSAFLRLLTSGVIVADVRTSMSRLVIAYGLAIVVGFLIGLLMALNRSVFELFDPPVELLRPISAIAWIPIALVIFGVGNVLPIFILTYVAIFPVILNTIAGIRAVDPTLIRAARTMGVGSQTIFRQVILPSALPTILTGLRLSAGLAWIALIASELVGAPSGLGFAIQYYAELFRTNDAIAMIATVAILGYLTDLLMRWVQRIVIPWEAS